MGLFGGPPKVTAEDFSQKLSELEAQLKAYADEALKKQKAEADAKQAALEKKVSDLQQELEEQTAAHVVLKTQITKRLDDYEKDVVRPALMHELGVLADQVSSDTENLSGTIKGRITNTEVKMDGELGKYEWHDILFA